MSTMTTGGTPSHMAPELLFPAKFNKTSAQPTKPADIYAFGMVVFEVLTGRQPFYDKNWQPLETVFHVMDGKRPTKPSDVEEVGFGGGTWKLVEECWIEEPEGRPTIEHVLAHLIRVAASSKVVGPTPGIANNPLEPDPSRKPFIWLATTPSLTLTCKVQFCYPDEQPPWETLPV